MDDLLNPVLAKIGHITGWLDNYRVITEAVPYVEQQLQIARWEEDALRQQPLRPGEPGASGVIESLRRDSDHLLHSLPTIPTYDPVGSR